MEEVVKLLQELVIAVSSFATNWAAILLLVIILALSAMTWYRLKFTEKVVMRLLDMVSGRGAGSKDDGESGD